MVARSKIGSARGSVCGWEVRVKYIYLPCNVDETEATRNDRFCCTRNHLELNTKQIHFMFSHINRKAVLSALHCSLRNTRLEAFRKDPRRAVLARKEKRYE